MEKITLYQLKGCVIETIQYTYKTLIYHKIVASDKRDRMIMEYGYLTLKGTFSYYIVICS